MGIFKSKNKVNQENTEIDYRKNKIKSVRILSCFAEDTLETIAEKRLGRVHITVIDENLKNPKQWFEAGLFLYDCLLFLLEETDYQSFLYIPFSFSENPTKIEDIDFSFVKENIYQEEPPMLNIVHQLGDRGGCVFLENLSKELQMNVHFGESLEEEVGYVRFLSVSKF